MRRPIVRMIRQPPIEVPSVRAPPQASLTQSGTERVSRWPLASKQCGDHAHRLLCVVGAVTEGEGGRHRPLGAADRRLDPAGRPPQRRPFRRAKRSPKPRPSSGETASAISTPKMPTGFQPSMPPQWIASMPASAIAAPTRPPTSACAELEGNPRHQVSRFQSVAASTPAPIDRHGLEPKTP